MRKNSPIHIHPPPPFIFILLAYKAFCYILPPCCYYSVRIFIYLISSDFRLDYLQQYFYQFIIKKQTIEKDREIESVQPPPPH
jgi:hypothetical protein